jgi:hypothetical protein
MYTYSGKSTKRISAGKTLKEEPEKEKKIEKKWTQEENERKLEFKWENLYKWGKNKGSRVHEE